MKTALTIDYNSKIETLECKRKLLCTERNTLNDEIVKLSEKIEKLREQQEKEQMSKPMTPTQEAEYFLFEDGCVSGERYKARSKYWGAKGLYSSGYNPETEQVSLKLMLYKGDKDNLEQTITATEEVLPLLKVHNGVKRLSIFEHTLSEDGIWSVEITDDSYDLILSRYHRKSTEKSFDNLRALIQYIQEHHYYENSVDNNEED